MKKIQDIRTIVMLAVLASACLLFSGCWLSWG